MLQQFERLEQSLRELPLASSMPPDARRALLASLDAGSQAVALFDAGDRLVYANRSFRDAWSIVDDGNVTFESMIRRCHAGRCGALIDTPDIDNWLIGALWRRSAAPERAFEVDFWDGRWFWVTEQRLSDGWLLTFAQDITALKQSEKRLSQAHDAAVYAANTDPLTYLQNRRGATARLEWLFEAQARFSLALIDLVHFKQINDSYGHAVGDAVLVEFARRLMQAVPSDCMVARLAGDEFAVIGSPRLSPAEFRSVAEKFMALHRDPFSVAGHTLDIGVSIGIANAQTDAKDVGGLLSAADEAMYRAKQSGRHGLRVFDPEMGEARREQAALRRDLPEAFASRQFLPYYQPVVDLRTNALIKFEMLARWEHPARGTLTPDRFLPVLSGEQLGQMTRQLLRRAGEDFRDVEPFPRIAFNVAAPQLKLDGVVADLASLEAEGAIPLAKLEMEVTESALVMNPAEAAAAVDAVRAMGVSTALDDFGVGFSSLKHLREIKFDRLKLDRSFVQNITVCDRDRAFIGAIIGLARRLGLTVIVEGVEDARSAEALAGLGCDYGQGYLYGRPAPAAVTLERLLESRQPFAIPPQDQAP